MVNSLSTIDRLAGHVLVVGFEGTSAPPWVLQAADLGRIAGVILFKRNVVDVRQTAELLRQIEKPFDEPPLFAVDQEGGRVARMSAPVITLPPMRTLGAIDDPELTEKTGRLLGEQLQAIGFTCNFSPVLDVDTNPENPVIGDRSFGSSAETVIRHAIPFGRGLAGAGLLACGKHFPGHGDTVLDSHLALPRLSHSPGRLEAVELAPFRAACGELESLMTAHVVFEALDAERPATLSPPVITGLLRGRLGYQGLIVSDDLEMAAVREGWGVGESARLAVAAGCDALLVCSKEEWVDEARDALVSAAKHDTGFRVRLEEAAERTRRVRAAHPPRPAADPDSRVTALLEERGRELESVLASG